MQYEPAGHSKQAAWPDTFMNRPATQALHEPWCVPSATVPCRHAVGSFAPSGHSCPTKQSVQLV